MQLAPTDQMVGFIGLGNMGGPMARNIAAAGFELLVTDLDQAKVDAIVAGGARRAANVDEVAQRCDLVLTSLPGPLQVEAVGEQLLGTMRPGTVWADLSTNDLRCARRLDGPAAAAQVGLIDAPVTGGAEGAEAGTLTVLVGGEQVVYDRCVPILAAIGARYDLLGGRGAGYVAKIAQVSLCYTQSVCLIEALLLGAKGGVDPHKMLSIVQHSTGRSYVADLYGPEILNGNYDATFALELAAKDLRLAMELATTVGAELPFMASVTDFYAETVERFGAAAPHLIALQAIERQNDLILHEQVGQPLTEGATS